MVFAIGAGIDFNVLLTSGLAGIILGLMTVFLSGGAAVAGVYLWHKIRRTPPPARNVVSGVAESAVTGRYRYTTLTDTDNGSAGQEPSGMTH